MAGGWTTYGLRIDSGRHQSTGRDEVLLGHALNIIVNDCFTINGLIALFVMALSWVSLVTLATFTR